jgi:hemolysin-activating ACP:hemolysin acyltransferase
MGRLKPEEWRSGRNHIIVDFVSPFVTDEVEKKRMLASVFAGGKWAEK